MTVLDGVGGRRFLLPALVAAMGVLALPGTVLAKCFPPAPASEAVQPVLMLDGVIQDGEPEQLESLVDVAEVQSVEILCWNPRTGKFGTAGIPMVYVTTKAALASARDPLVRVIEAQAAYVLEHGAPAPTLTDLQILEPGEPASMEYELTADGWSASFAGPGLVYRCRVAAGLRMVAMPGGVASPDGTRGEVACDHDRGVAILAMKERFARE